MNDSELYSSYIDLAIVAQVAEVNEVIRIKRAYDFSYAIQAEQFLNKQGWKP